MPRNEGKAKLGRKALKDVSNNNDVGTISKIMHSKKKLSERENEDLFRKADEDDALDRLLLVRSDLSSLIHQVTLSERNRQLMICLDTRNRQ